MRPLILLSNDDGVQAKGLNELIDFLSPLADLFVMAPDSARSGASCSISSYEPLRYRTLLVRPGLKVCACNGTPVDCTKLGLELLGGRKPDMVVSGINHGDNASVSVHYSGTMGVVLEGCMKGIPSVGFSLCDADAEADFSAAGKFVRAIVARVLEEGLPSGICLNVNIPKYSGRDYDGIRICRMTRGRWSGEFFGCEHPRGMKYYWLTGEFVNEEPECEGTDFWALAHNFVAVTPTQIDVTAYGAMDGLKDLEVL